MDLPPPLRQAVDRALSGVALSELMAASAALSQRYRGERHGRPYVATDGDALAYLAVRLPATYAAVRASFAAVAQARPDFAPTTFLDVGAGPGTALWAATDCWLSVAEALLVEASPIFQAYGGQLAADAALPRITWRIGDVVSDSIDAAPRDLVSAAYVLNELDSAVRARVLQQLWRATADVLVIVEPGTPAGWELILAARRDLIASGAYVIAPCPHAQACPLQPPDWCHFAERLSRSRLHRQTKGADVPWEDEKFSYVVLSRRPAAADGARVIARPRKGSGRVTLKLCRPDGSAGDALLSRRDGALFKRAMRCAWGSLL
jgi:ribosomal protein RSM22 (predicted rRNA methylase)